MPAKPCPQCEQPVDEQELLCATCGSVLIPQLSRVELQRLTEAERNRYFRPFIRGLGIGLLLGMLIVGVLIVSAGGLRGAIGSEAGEVESGPGWQDLSLLGTIAIMGGMVGLMRGLLATQPHDPPHSGPPRS